MKRKESSPIKLTELQLYELLKEGDPASLEHISFTLQKIAVLDWQAND